MTSSPVIDGMIQEQLFARRTRLLNVLPNALDRRAIEDLLHQVDGALSRLEGGTFGICTACREPIEADRLAADPLVALCLDHLTPAERRALEADLELASRVQTGLLPPRAQQRSGWDVAFGYAAARVVSGDYCDLIPTPDGAVHVMLGDVSGKGVAAALLMSQLHALFRALVPGTLPIHVVCGHVNDTFAASVPSTHYATLVCVRASPDGSMAVVNAGHLPALVWRAGRVEEVESGGLPLGMFARQQYQSAALALRSDDFAVLYSDGIVEAEDDQGVEFGRERLRALVERYHALPAAALVERIEREVAHFSSHAPRSDDRTVAVLRRA